MQINISDGNTGQPAGGENGNWTAEIIVLLAIVIIAVIFISGWRPWEAPASTLQPTNNAVLNPGTSTLPASTTQTTLPPTSNNSGSLD